METIVQQGVGFATMGFFVFYLVSKLIPAMEKRAEAREASFVAALQAQEAHFRECVEKQEDAHREQLALVMASTKDLVTTMARGFHEEMKRTEKGD